MYNVYTGYCGTGEIEHGLCACTVDNPLAKAIIGDYLSVHAHKPFSISHLSLVDYYQRSGGSAVVIELLHLIIFVLHSLFSTFRWKCCCCYRMFAINVICP